MAVPASLTCAITGLRPATCLTANSIRARFSESVRLTDSPAWVGSASASAPLRDMEVEQFAEAIEVDAPLRRERRHRRMHKSGLEGGHENGSRD